MFNFASSFYVFMLVMFIKCNFQINQKTVVNYQREAVVVITQYIQPIQMELTYIVTWTQMVDTGQFVFYNSSILLLVSSSRIRTYSLLNWPKVYIPHCSVPFIECVWVHCIIPFSKIFLTVLFDTLINNVSFFYF